MPYCNTSLVDIGDEAVDDEQPLFANITFHYLGLWITALFCVLASATAIVLMLGHAMHYSCPWQQKHIIRILAMIPIYAIISTVSYWQYKHAIYWEVLRDCYEAFAIASFFTLLCHYVEPTLHDQKEYFRKIEVKNWVLPVNWFQKCTGGQNKGIFRKPRSGLTWFNVIWIGVFQYCAIRVAFTFVAMITQFTRRYCESSLNPAFAHIWVLVFEGTSVTVAMYCLIQFYIQLKEDLAEYKPFLKVACIKLVIFFSFWQSFLISFLTSGSHQVLKTSVRIAYPDLKIGIPSMLLTIEMTIFAIMHHFAFPWKAYDIRNSSDPSAHYQGGTVGWKALADAFNPWDIIKAIGRGFRWLFVGARNREQDISYKEPGMNNAIALQRGGSRDKRGGLERQDTMDSVERQESETGYAGFTAPTAYTGARGYTDGTGLSPQVTPMDERGDIKEYIPVEDGGREDRSGLLSHAQGMPRS